MSDKHDDGDSKGRCELNEAALEPEAKEKTDSEQAFEIIELATNDIDALSQAFEMISAICNELNSEQIELAETPVDYLLH